MTPKNSGIAKTLTRRIHYGTKQCDQFHKILIETIQQRCDILFQRVDFHKQRAITPEGMMCIKLEEKITVLNNVTKFHKILSQSIRQRANIVSNGE